MVHPFDSFTILNLVGINDEYLIDSVVIVIGVYTGLGFTSRVRKKLRRALDCCAIEMLQCTGRNDTANRERIVLLKTVYSTLFSMLFGGCSFFRLRSDYFSGIFIRKQRCLSAGVQEQNRFIPLEESLTNQIDHPGRRAARVDGVKQEALVAGE